SLEFRERELEADTNHHRRATAVSKKAGQRRSGAVAAEAIHYCPHRGIEFARDNFLRQSQAEAGRLHRTKSFYARCPGDHLGTKRWYPAPNQYTLLQCDHAGIRG